MSKSVVVYVVIASTKEGLYINPSLFHSAKEAKEHAKFLTNEGYIGVRVILSAVI